MTECSVHVYQYGSTDVQGSSTTAIVVNYRVVQHSVNHSVGSCDCIRISVFINK